MESGSGDRILTASLGSIGLLIFSMFLVPLRDVLGAQNVAIILLVGVEVLALLAGRQGALLGALIAALSFDFFFTEPYLRLVIDDTHDIITTVLLFAAGIGTAELGSLRVKRALRQHPSPPAASGG
jgi:K+-sensing histidine kinase KdpD